MLKSIVSSKKYDKGEGQPQKFQRTVSNVVRTVERTTTGKYLYKREPGNARKVGG